MKRFYSIVCVEKVGDIFTILLDGKSLKTPKKASLKISSIELAKVIANEWRTQGDQIALEGMPMTRLTYSCIDLVSVNRKSVVDKISGYGLSDLLCYWAKGPKDLVEIQHNLWQPLLDWAANSLGVKFRTTSGIIHIEQDNETLEKLRSIIGEFGNEELTSLHDFTTILGSVIIGLATLYGKLAVSDAWTAGMIDSEYQKGRWGKDELAVAREKQLRAELEFAYDFIAFHRKTLTLTH